MDYTVIHTIYSLVVGADAVLICLMHEQSCTDMHKARSDENISLCKRTIASHATILPETMLHEDVMAWKPQITRFMGPTWGLPGSCRPQMGPMLAPWTLLSGTASIILAVWSFEGAFLVNPSPPEKNGRHFADDMVCLYFYWNFSEVCSSGSYSQ